MSPPPPQSAFSSKCGKAVISIICCYNRPHAISPTTRPELPPHHAVRDVAGVGVARAGAGRFHAGCGGLARRPSGNGVLFRQRRADHRCRYPSSKSWRAGLRRPAATAKPIQRLPIQCSERLAGHACNGPGASRFAAAVVSSPSLTICGARICRHSARAAARPARSSVSPRLNHIRGRLQPTR